MTVEGTLDRAEQIERVKRMLVRAITELERGNTPLAWRIIQEIDYVLEPIVTDKRGLPWGDGLGTDWHFDQLKQALKSQVKQHHKP